MTLTLRHIVSLTFTLMLIITPAYCAGKRVARDEHRVVIKQRDRCLAQSGAIAERGALIRDGVAGVRNALGVK